MGRGYWETEGRCLTRTFKVDNFAGMGAVTSVPPLEAE